MESLVGGEHGEAEIFSLEKFRWTPNWGCERIFFVDW